MNLDPDERVLEAGPARYGATAQASMEKLMKECGMEMPDGTAVPGTGGIAEVEALHRMVNPPTELTAEQQIRLGCLRIASATYDAICMAGREPADSEEFQAGIKDAVAYVTTGNWPDTNGTKE